MSALSQLRERVERASGPVRDIDYSILRILDPAEYARLQKTADADISHARANGLTNRDEACWLSAFGATPRYTASIDDALALVERKLPGAEYEITTLYGVAHVSLPLNCSDHPSESGRRPDGNVPLAIVSALLRALEYQEQDGG